MKPMESSTKQNFISNPNVFTNGSPGRLDTSPSSIQIIIIIIENVHTDIEKGYYRAGRRQRMHNNHGKNRVENILAKFYWTIQTCSNYTYSWQHYSPLWFLNNGIIVIPKLICSLGKVAIFASARRSNRSRKNINLPI